VRAQARWRRLRAKLLAQAGESERAVELARDAVTLTERCEAPNLQADALVDLAEVLGRGDEALAALSEALRLYERKGNLASARQTAELLRTAQDASPSKVVNSTRASASAAHTRGSQSAATSSERSSR
jgi:tetratricopeptide (TPR) repeat protein